ncbi:MAG: O-antigen/teichoic acid export membrane protein [bacterium]|jgi:O-antigen/teichoic acid export membrane protein
MKKFILLNGRKILNLHQTGFLFLLMSLFISHFISLFVKITLSKWLSPEDFGRFSLLNEGLMFVAQLATLGLPLVMVRFGLKEKNLPYYLSGTLRLFLMLCGVILIGYYLVRIQYAFFEDQETTHLFDLIILLAPSFAFFNYFLAYLSAQKKSEQRAKIIFLQKLLFAASLIVGCYFFQKNGVIGGFIFFALSFFILILYLFPKIPISVPFFPYKKVTYLALWEGVTFLLYSSSTFLIYSIAERYLNNLKLISQLAIAFSFTIIAKFTFASINDVIYPYLTEKKTKKILIFFITQILSIHFLLSCGLIFLTLQIFPYLIHYLLGENYSQAIPLFQLMMIGEIFIGFSLFFEMILLLLGGVKLKAFSMTIAVSVLILFLPKLLQEYQVFGAAYGFLLFSFLRFFLGGISCGYYLSIFSTRSLARTKNLKIISRN